MLPPKECFVQCRHCLRCTALASKSPLVIDVLPESVLSFVGQVVSAQCNYVAASTKNLLGYKVLLAGGGCGADQLHKIY